MGNGESVQVASPALGGSSFSFNGHRTSRRTIDEDYVDLGEKETFSKEQMEDQFTKIVVSELRSREGWRINNKVRCCWKLLAEDWKRIEWLGEN